ncbi:MAG: DUF2061 domain-containing protein [Candidatus Pacebacteria bacterium]|nr:DUF2061 domain-containing protein [Candidatus Paceibacterota bacterium]
MLFYETRTRTVAKTILWRIVATLITWGTIYWFTGEIKESIEITLIAALIGMTAYYFYERIWNSVGWGKIIK